MLDSVLLQFQWRNDGSVQNQPGVRIDDIEITYSSLAMPRQILHLHLLPGLRLQFLGLPQRHLHQVVMTTIIQHHQLHRHQETTPSGSVGAVATSANLTSLSPGTTYYYWVRSDCGFNGPWTSSANFTTLCTAVAPWTENFDGTSLPSCWSICHNWWSVGFIFYPLEYIRMCFNSLR